MANNARSTLKLVNPPGVRTERQLRRADMAALEQLPQPVRWLLNEITICLSTYQVLQFYRSIARQAAERGGSPYDAEVHTCRKLLAIEASDIDAFSARHKRAHGYVLPHVAAMATVLRYGPLVRSGRRAARAALIARRGAQRLPLPVSYQEAA
jgi:hypothetical protein